MGNSLTQVRLGSHNTGSDWENYRDALGSGLEWPVYGHRGVLRKIDPVAIKKSWRASFKEIHGVAQEECGEGFDGAEFERQTVHIANRFCGGNMKCTISVDDFRRYLDAPTDWYLDLFRSSFPKLWNLFIDEALHDLSENGEMKVSQVPKLLFENSCILVHMALQKQTTFSEDDAFELMENLFVYGDIREVCQIRISGKSVG